MKRLLMTLLLLLTVTLTQAQLTAQLTTTDYNQSEIVSDEYDTELNLNMNMEIEPTLSNPNLNMNMMKPYGATKNRSGGGEFAIGLLVSGAAFIIGGLTTKVPYEGYHGEDKPFFQQGPRMYAIMGGSVILATGLIISIP